MWDLWGLDAVGVLAAGAAFFAIAASPGPATLATALVAMRAGRRDGHLFGLGLSVGLAVWGLVAATGLGAVLQASEQALTALKILGGAYLLWLAYGSFRSARRRDAVPPARELAGGWFRKGLLLNLSNPKAVVAWMATLSLGVAPGSGPAQLIAATGLCAVLGAGIYAGYVFVFSTRGAMQAYARLRRWIDGLVAGLFALAGLGLLRSALAR
ncbi:MAG: LysE family translocator [Pseudomonadota bacterium]